MPDSAGAAAGSAFNASVSVVENVEPAEPTPAEADQEEAPDGVVSE